MKLIGMFDKKHEISIIKDPFSKKCINNIAIQYSTWGNNPHWYARIEFVNGNTKGEQRTNDCQTFDQVMAEVKQIMETIN